VVKTFFVQMFFVPSASMHPQLVEDDRILVEKISTWDGEVERGDVVVFEDPGGWLGVTPEPVGIQALLSLVGLYPDGGHLVKRVIGVGGDRVACCDAQGRLTVNGEPVDESAYLRDGVEPSQRSFEVEVPEDAIWVMGDNRPNSQDSRFHMQEQGGGTVPDDRVVGRVWAIVWPTDRFELLERPDSLESLAP
jgi:signal peptidase I